MPDQLHPVRARGGDTGPTGYLHPTYASAFEEFGSPRFLRSSGGWILEREIPGSRHRDAMGCYPRFLCRDWVGLCSDLDLVAPCLVSLTLVTDPFASAAPAELEPCFDSVRSYKKHYVVDLGHPATQRTSRRHRDYARHARGRGIRIEVSLEPAVHLDEWVRLYDFLVARHGIRNLRRFSRRSFAAQLSVPGAVMFRAVRGGTTVAAHVWYLHGDVAYSHLQATDDSGYRARAPYALYSEALHWLSTTCGFADLGASAGSEPRTEDGLSQFKRGWATDTRQSYLCTRIFDRVAYDELRQAADAGATSYFPAYRATELV